MNLKTHFPLILGSQSPRRRNLLTELGLSFEVEVRDTDETIPEGLSPKEVVQHISEEKAKAFADKADSHIIVTADTIVVLGDKILGKPQSEQEAVEMLQMLCGGTHEVMTAVSVYHKDQLKTEVDITKVVFRELTEAEIRLYVRKHVPYDKAGSYGVQDWIGMVGITRIEGNFYTVMGLPVYRLWEMLAGYMG